MAVNGNPTQEITARQHRAIIALITEKDNLAASTRAGIGYRTLCRWLEDPKFQAELERVKGEMIDGAIRSLINDLGKNQQTARDIRDNARTPVNIKLMAYRAIDQSLLKWREADIEQRLEALEKAVFNGK
jgi:phage terminase small subunit